MNVILIVPLPLELHSFYATYSRTTTVVVLCREVSAKRLEAKTYVTNKLADIPLLLLLLLPSGQLIKFERFREVEKLPCRRSDDTQASLPLSIH